MTIAIIGANVLTEQWRVVAATKTKTILVQSKSDDNSIGCQFNLRLRYGVEGVETPIYSQETTTFLEPNQARLIDFRDLVPGDFQDSYPVGAWQIEAQIAYNFAPILIRYYEVDLRDADKAFFQGQLNSKADSDHEHVPSDIANLETLLLAKLNAPTTPPTPGQILRATGPDTWTWQTVQTGDGGGVVLPAEFVTTVNGETGDVVIDPPPLATATQSGLISAQLFALITGQNATNGQVLQFTGGTPTWGNLTVFATPVQWQKLTANATLETDKRYFVKGGSEFTLPATVAGSIEVSNQTTSTVTIIAAGTARINGIATDNSTAITQQAKVAIKPGKKATFVADSGNWESQESDNAFLSFSWNNSLFTENNSNPAKSWGILNYLGRNYGQSTFTNPSSGGVIQVVASSVFGGSFTAAPTVLVDGVAGSTNSTIWLSSDSAGQWVAIKLPRRVKLKSFLIVTGNSFVGFFPRNFRLRISTDSTLVLSSGMSLSPFSITQTYSSQTQINTNGTGYLLPVTSEPECLILVLESTGANSGGSSYFSFSELEIFGDLFI